MRWLVGLSVALASGALVACGGEPTATPIPTPTATPVPPAGWRYEEIAPPGPQSYPGGGEAFIIGLPPGWTATPMQGIDSFIREILGDGVSLNWDLGWYSSPLPYDEDPAYVVTTEEIGGREAKLVRSASKGVAGVYFPFFTGGNPDGPSPVRLTIYGEGLSAVQMDMAFVMFRTVR